MKAYEFFWKSSFQYFSIKAEKLKTEINNIYSMFLINFLLNFSKRLTILHFIF